MSHYQSRPTPVSFNPIFFIPAYPSFIHTYLFLSLTVLLSQCQTKFTTTTFNPGFFISVYPLYIHLYFFLSLVYPSLFLYVSLSIQTDACLFQPHFLYPSLSLVYTPVSFSIFYLSTTIFFYILFIQICTYLFKSPFSKLSLSIVY